MPENHQGGETESPGICKHLLGQTDSNKPVGMRGPGSGDRWAFTVRGAGPKGVWRGLLKKDAQNRNSYSLERVLPVCFSSVCSAVFKVEKSAENNQRLQHLQEY